jgi:hypothetical protein
MATPGGIRVKSGVLPEIKNSHTLHVDGMNVATLSRFKPNPYCVVRLLIIWP